MTMSKEDDITTRRSVLKTIGAGSAVLTVGSANLAGARPPGGKCQPPEGTWCVAKFENEEGDLVFEKTGMPVLDPSGAFEFSNVQFKDGDPEEITRLEWDSYPYAITHVSVKAGPECFELPQPDTLPGGGDVQSGTDSGVVDIDDLETKKAISHVLFCAIPYWQIDIANTASPYEIGNPSNFIEGGVGTGSDCVEWLVGGGASFFDNYSGLTTTASCDGAEAGFELTGVPPADDGSISVISAVSPAYGELHAPNWDDVVDTQQIYDEDAAVYNDGDVGSSFTHSVDIPTV